jgi:hypothetical protein
VRPFSPDNGIGRKPEGNIGPGDVVVADLALFKDACPSDLQP